MPAGRENVEAVPWPIPFILPSDCACFCYAKSAVNMTWLFFVLILSTMAVVCVGCAVYLRVRHHMKTSADAHHVDTGHPAGESR